MKKTKKMSKTTKIAIVTLLLIAILDVTYFSYIKASTKRTNTDNLPVLTVEDLERYDGSNLDLPVYIALDGKVYDVSPGRADFYNPGESYHYLVGKDSSQELHIFGAALIKKKYKVIGVYQP